MPYAFIAESTLGKLLKWLRIMGFDTIYAADHLVQTLMEPDGEHRIYLTRTRRAVVPKKASRRIIIISDNPFEQLKEVIHAVGIVSEDVALFSRCIRCNIPIQLIDKEHVQELVPDHILETHHVFHSCKGCGRIYWPGSHTEHSREIIKRLFE